jgi:hypothetical protein
VFDSVFQSDHEKLKEFKQRHHREGEFTDEDGVIALATSFYLGVTLRIFSRSNTKIQPYTEHNPGYPTIFNIFYDTRSSGHFQSLIQPKLDAKKSNQWTPKDAEEDYIKKFHVEQEFYTPKQTIRVGKMENITKNNLSTNKKIADKESRDMEKSKNKKTSKQKMEPYTKVAKKATRGNKQQEYQKYVLAFELADKIQDQQEEKLSQKITPEARQSLMDNWYATCAANGVIPNKEIEEAKTTEAKNWYKTEFDEAKKQLDILSREKEEFLKQNNKLLADISDKEKEKASLANENEIKNSELESKNHKINALKSELLEANTTNKKQSDETKKRLDTLSKEKEESSKINETLRANISEREKAKCALTNENNIKSSELESMDLKINSLKTELLEANMSNKKKSEEIKKQLDKISQQEEESSKINETLKANISDREKAKCLTNESRFMDHKIKTLKTELLEANMSNKKQ